MRRNIKWSERPTVEQCVALEMRHFTRAAVFQPQSGSPDGFYKFRADDDPNEDIAFCVERSATGAQTLWISHLDPERAAGTTSRLEYAIEIVAQPCRFGGERYWFACPVVRSEVVCGRRAGTLYLPPGQRYFGCRICHNLTYYSAQQHDSRVNQLAKLPISDLLEFRAHATGGALVLLAKAAGHKSTVLIRQWNSSKKRAALGY